MTDSHLKPSVFKDFTGCQTCDWEQAEDSQLPASLDKILLKGQETEQETHQNTFKRTEDWAGDSTDTEVGKNKTNVGFYEQRDSKQTEFKLGGGLLQKHFRNHLISATDR